MDKDELVRWILVMTIISIIAGGFLIGQTNHQKHTQEMANKGYTQELVGSTWIWKKSCQ
jgi:hypothetical protein